MKHVTLLVSAFLVGSAFAQTKVTQTGAQKHTPGISLDKPSSASGETPKAFGDVIWSNDFSYLGEWTTGILPSGTEDANHGWSITDAGTTWKFTTTEINSTSGGEYALLQNGDPINNSGATAVLTGVQFVLMYDSIFDLSSYSDVNFQFQQYGARFIENQEVQASLDGGTTWTTFFTNADLPNWTAGGGSAYANPTNRSVSLTAAMPGADLSSVMFRFLVNWPSGSGGNDGIMYGWFIDDVKLVEGSPNDLRLGAVFPFTGAGIAYTKFPKSQAGVPAATVSIAGWVSNDGSATQNASLEASTTGFTGSSAPASITAYTTDSLFLATNYTIPTTPGVYNFDVEVTAGTTLENTVNDTTTLEFEVTDQIMAVDGFNGTAASLSGSFTMFANQAPNDRTGIGSLFEVYKNGVIDGFQVGIGQLSASQQANYIDRPFTVVLLDVSGATAVALGESDEHTLVAGDFGTLVTLPIANPISVTAGQQLIALAYSYVGPMNGTQNTGGVPVAFAGVIPAGMTYGVTGGNFDTDLVYLASDPATPDVVEAPVVRIRFQGSLATDELVSKTDVSVAPNPFTNETSLNFNLKSDADVSVVVTDLAGRQVVSVSKQMTAGANSIAIDGSALQAGVYVYTLKAGNSVISDRIVKK